MRIAVITPYYNEPLAWLEKNYLSVKSQTIETRQIFVADGAPNAAIDGWDVDHIILGKPHKDGGSFPRGVGALQAVAHGFDAIAFLDADNWYMPDHIETMVQLHQRTQFPVCAATRILYTMDEVYKVPLNPVLPQIHIDTNCMFLTRSTYPLLPFWLHMRDLDALFHAEGGADVYENDRSWLPGSALCDHAFTYALKTLNQKAALADHPTVCYRMKYASFYKKHSLPVPDGCIEADCEPLMVWWEELPPIKRVEIALAALPKDCRPKIDLVEKK